MARPWVACVMLVNGRSEMTRRAIFSFHAQAYRLLWWPGSYAVNSTDSRVSPGSTKGPGGGK